MVQDALDDQYEATLAKAGMRTFQHRTHAAEFASGVTVIDDLPNASAGKAADDKVDVRLACADTIDLWARTNAADNNCEEGVLDENQSVCKMCKTLSECSTTVPDDFVQLVYDPESPLMPF